MFLKFLLTVAVIAAIWFGFKYWSRIQELKLKRQPKAVLPRRESAHPEAVQDLVHCRVCGTWRPGARSCGRPDCPY